MEIDRGERASGTTGRADDALTVRAYEDAEREAVVRGWHETNLASYRYVAEHQKHSLDDARAFFRDHVLTRCEVLVAARGTRIVGMLALEVPWIRQFAVFPGHQRRGVGTALLALARQRARGELRLYTFQRNAAARAFYGKHGFVPVAFGVSPAPESEPDVEYHWVAQAPPLPNAVCPLCGGPNACAPAASGCMSTPCWCADVTIAQAVLARIPQAQRNVACICRRCAQQGSEGVAP